MGFLSKLLGGYFWGLGCRDSLKNNSVEKPVKLLHKKKKKKKKKLYLVLDLDLTLLNSIQLVHLTAKEEYLKAQSDSPQDPKGSLFILEHMGMMTKLRPFVRKFLKEASQMFELYINTRGDRPYALQMAELLDPGDEYFGGRVISRHDDHGAEKPRKSLDILQGRESTVVILDDTEDVWEQHKDNLILMKKYNFFASSGEESGDNRKSLSQLLGHDDDDDDDVLASILEVLRKIHHAYFNQFDCNSEAGSTDVRLVMKSIRKRVLRGCKIVFPTGFLRVDRQYVMEMAEQLGATCTTETDTSATHVVSTDAASQLSRWAVEKKKFLVDPRWIEATYYFWKKQPEAKFPVEVAWPGLSTRC